jgi:outer membrane protein assembly factor BamA
MINIRYIALMALAIGYILPSSAFAQIMPDSTNVTTISEEYSLVDEALDEHSAIVNDTIKTKKAKKVSIAPMPTISYDRSQGFGAGAMAMAFFSLDKSKKSPLSRVMAMGTYSTIGTWYTVGFFEGFFKEDKYRVISGGGYMNYHFQIFQAIGDKVYEIPYVTRGYFAFAAPSIRVWKKLYLGAGAATFRTNITFDTPAGSEVVPNNLNSLVATIKYDTRDNQYNPKSGWFLNSRVQYFPDFMNEEYIFGKLFLSLNQYTKITEKLVLANRVNVTAAFGDVPFMMQDVIGRTDLRGYTKGEYRGDQTLAAQSEVRYSFSDAESKFWRKFGVVGFGGLATAHTTSTEEQEGHWFSANSKGTWSKPLPAGGLGARFQMVEKDGNKINAGIDVAKGWGDWGFYLRITEAF